MPFASASALYACSAGSSRYSGGARGAVCWLLCAIHCGGAAWSSVDAAETASAAPVAIVRLVVDYGDGVEKHFTQIAWQEGMTVQQVLDAAQRHPRGIRVRVRGGGATAFLLEIDGLKNEAAAGRNWIYQVNQRVGDRGFARQPVAAGDTVLWKFDTYE